MVVVGRKRAAGGWQWRTEEVRGVPLTKREAPVRAPPLFFCTTCRLICRVAGQPIAPRQARNVSYFISTMLRDSTPSSCARR